MTADTLAHYAAMLAEARAQREPLPCPHIAPEHRNCPGCADPGLHEFEVNRSGWHWCDNGVVVERDELTCGCSISNAEWGVLGL